jgi:hypothetical protein
VWLKSAQRRRGAGAIVALAALLVACGGGNAQGPKARPPGPAHSRSLDPTDLFPADLDLVVRLDVARMRAGIGPLAAENIEARALQGAGDDVLKDAIRCADVIWFATRLGDLEAGDHVIAVEGSGCAPELEPSRWESVASANKQVKIWNRKGDGASRAGTARILTVGSAATVFVSPVELDSVARVLRDGPDARRSNPTAEGLASFDLRAERLPPGLERRFPSIASIIAGLSRVRGSAVLVDEGLQIEAEILSPTDRGAEKALRFLSALRDNVEDPRLVLLMRSVKIEQVERSVRLRLVVPARLLLALVSATKESKDEP